MQLLMERKYNRRVDRNKYRKILFKDEIEGDEFE